MFIINYNSVYLDHLNSVQKLQNQRRKNILAALFIFQILVKGQIGIKQFGRLKNLIGKLRNFY